MWFEDLTGFKEIKEEVYKNLMVKNRMIKSLVNAKEYA